MVNLSNDYSKPLSNLDIPSKLNGFFSLQESRITDSEILTFLNALPCALYFSLRMCFCCDL